MHGEPDRAVDLFAVANIAGQASVRSVWPTRLRAASTRPASRERGQHWRHDRKEFGDRLADTHRRTRYDHNLSGEIHARVVSSAAGKSSCWNGHARRVYRCAHNAVQSTCRSANSGHTGDGLLPCSLVSARSRVVSRHAVAVHIFEPRYKEMIGECLATNSPFGVVRATEQGMAEIGCTAENVVVTRKYPTGAWTSSRRSAALRSVEIERPFIFRAK